MNRLGLNTDGLRKIIKTPPGLDIFKEERPDWDTFFMGMAYFISTRSTCSDRMTGAVAVVDKTVIATGFNGAPRGIKDCLEQGDCIRENRDKSQGKDYDNCFAAHAEVNAIANNAFMGAPTLRGASLYTTVYPCTGCARLIINAGIKKVYYCEKLPNDNGLAPKLFDEAKVQCERIAKDKIAAVTYKALDYLVDRDEDGKK